MNASYRTECFAGGGRDILQSVFLNIKSQHPLIALKCYRHLCMGKRQKMQFTSKQPRALGG